MKGIKVDVKKGETKFVEDEVSLEDFYLSQKPSKINLGRVLNLLGRLDPEMAENLGEVIKTGIEEEWFDDLNYKNKKEDLK